VHPIAWRLILALAGAKLAAHLATDWQYGFQRDELYYVDTARHLAWGFVDFPSVTPLIAFLDQLAFPGSLEGLRLAPALAGSALVVLAALIARELGGDRLAQGLAGLAAAISPMFLGANLLFQTVTFDQLTWAGAIYVLARLLRTGDRRFWLLLGVAFGVGLAYIVLPHAAGYLLSFAIPGVLVPLISADKYFDFVSTLFLAFGIVMEFPVVLILLSKVGIVTSARLQRTRRYAALAIVVFAGPPEAPERGASRRHRVLRRWLGVAAAVAILGRAARGRRRAAACGRASVWSCRGPAGRAAAAQARDASRRCGWRSAHGRRGGRHRR